MATGEISMDEFRTGDVGPRDPKGSEQLSPTLQQINDMNLHYTDAEFEKLSLSPDSASSREVSEDVALRALKNLIKGPFFSNAVGAILRILSRESMQESSKKEIFRKALQEIADKANYAIRV